MDEDLIVLGGPAEAQAAGAETSEAVDASIPGQPAEGDAPAATPGKDPAEPAAPAPKPEGEEEGGEDKPKKRSGIHRMQEKIARLEAELATRSAPVGDSGDRAKAIEAEIGAAPKETDFDDYLAYERAQRQYDVRQALAEQRIADREAQASTRTAQAKREAMDAFNDKLDDVREAIPDADKVLKAAAEHEVKPHVSELVVDSEKGGLLAYYLAKNPAELAKLNGMSPIQAAKAVGALEHRLTLAKPNRTPSAPAPAKPVTGGAAPSSPDAEIDAWLAKTYGTRGSAR
ncbi:hypothetical protein FPV16_14965 [Methylobacterium sp. W2]|uniref:hypothetical protein n=1 Tax=Methylobacterium sp. W2 TaxID=2598107 RepID=UPI001D0C2FE8|nr:hypothetical protein [Methylobacterium sp. W2]MCC0807515.1 hypothetical protein [Methylobacterium sp. W2]